jgi:very-short-patch-repair endonuclease
MSSKKLITGQHVSPDTHQFARELRDRMTPSESRLWERLRANRLGGWHFRRQQVAGRYIVDFYCHRASLVVEVDGGIHMDRMNSDAGREEDLRRLGLTVLRFTNTEVNRDLEGVLNVILQACENPRAEET